MSNPVNGANTSRVLAIGIDAAEATLVRQLIEEGQLPALRSLLEEGTWLSVDSPAHIGSGAVWPTFMTGEEPARHGVYSDWSWRPDTMSLSRFDGRRLTPFWQALAQQEISLGVFDVPFAPPVGVTKGFEVSEWWAHDTSGAGLQVGPEEIVSLVEQSPAHPLSASRFVNTTPDSQIDLKELTTACIEGVRLRGALAERLISETKPRLALVVFPEIHHASHLTWHGVNPEHHLYNARERISDPRVPSPLSKQGPPLKQAPLLKEEPQLRNVYRALDREIARLIRAAGSDATVVVFSLHGMRPAMGIPTFLGPLLCETGFSRLAPLSSQSWAQRALSLLAATKKRTPEGLKQLYYKLMPTAATHKLARPTMLPAYDWENTRAFSLPTDQHGWIRINLAGREALGSVALDQYDETCDQLEKMLQALTTADGQLLVEEVIRTAVNPADALNNPLPDLVVHWRDAAFASPAKIKGSSVQAEPVRKTATGQHASAGFCIYHGSLDTGTFVAAKDLGRLMTAAL